MKIYVTHASSFDFRNELYEPIRKSKLVEQHDIVLPHEKSDEQYNSREYLKECDLVIAEVSYSSTGQGTELGWVDLYAVPIICIYKKRTKPSGSINVVCNVVREYKDTKEMIDVLQTEISNF